MTELSDFVQLVLANMTELEIVEWLELEDEEQVGSDGIDQWIFAAVPGVADEPVSVDNSQESG